MDKTGKNNAKQLEKRNTYINNPEYVKSSL